MPDNSNFDEYVNLAIKVVLDDASVSELQAQYLRVVQSLMESGNSLQESMNAAMNMSVAGEKFISPELQNQLVQMNKALLESAEAFKRADGYANELGAQESNVAESTEQVAQSAETATVAVEALTEAETNAAEAGKKMSTGQKEVAEKLDTEKFTGVKGFFNKWTSGIGDMGTVAKGVFGGVIGVTAIQALEKFIQYVGESIEVAAKFEKTMVAIEIGVRAMQRSGLDVTMQNTFDTMARLREEYAIFSEQDMAAGTETFVNNMREMGISQKQLTDLMELSAKAAVLSGKSYEDTTRIINLAVLTGYSRTLNTQLRGINFTTKLAQAEAERLGIVGKTFESMSAQERTMVTISLLTREMASYDTDIAEMKKTQAYQLGVASASLATIKKDLGESVLPVWVDILTVVKEVVSKVTQLLTIVFDAIKASVTLYKLWYDIILVSQEKLAPEKLQERWQEILDTAEHGYDAFAKFLYLDKLFGVEIGGYKPQLGDLTPEELAALGDSIVETDTELQKTRLDNEKEFAEESKRIEVERLQDIEDANTKYQRKLVDIDRQTQQKRMEAGRKLGYDLDEIDRDAQNSKLKAMNDYSQAVLQAERDLQDKLRELRDQAVFDLEEAVRTGNALQARKILRQYRYDKDQVIKGAQSEAEKRKDSLAQELLDIEAQRINKRKERMIDYQEQMADIAAWQSYEREAARRAYEQQLADINEAAKREIEALRAKHAQIIADLQKSLETQLSMMDSYNRAVAASQSTQPAAGSANAQGSVVLPNQDPNNISGHWGVPKFATGGTLLATKPTIAMFGEAGAEMATFTPLSKLGRMGGNVDTGVRGANGKLALEIMLSPGLVADITENTLGELAGVMASVERAR